MGKSVMVTEYFELTEEYMDVSKMNTEKFVYDDRMEMIMRRDKAMSANPISLYRNYLRSFCESINRDRKCKPAYMTACGFLPVGIEPVIMCGAINKDFIVPALHEKGVDYFQLKPMSPVLASYEPVSSMAISHDIWVNKLDAAKIVNKPAHNITSLDVLEVLGL